MRCRNPHRAAPPSAHSEEEDDREQWGPSETTPESSSSVSPAQYRRVRIFPSQPSGPFLQMCLPGDGSFLLPNFHGYLFIPHTSSAAVSRNSKTQPKTWLFLHFPPRRWYLHRAGLPCLIRSLHHTASAPRQQHEVGGTPCHQVFFCLTGIKTQQLFSQEHPRKAKQHQSWRLFQLLSP